MTMKINAILPDWLQTIFDVVGDVGLVLAMTRWAYKHRGQLRKLSFVAVFGIATGMILMDPSAISVSHVGRIPVGRYTSAGAYPADSYPNWLVGFWIPFFGIMISPVFIMAFRSHVKPVLSRLSEIVEKIVPKTKRVHLFNL
jgi:hypothetical protein